MKVTVKDLQLKELEFSVSSFNAYESLTILGELGQVLGPVFKKLNMEEIQLNPLMIITLLSEVQIEKFMITLQKVLNKASFENIPVDLKNVMWNKKLDILLKLAFEIVTEEYSDFLSSWGMTLGTEEVPPVQK